MSNIACRKMGLFVISQKDFSHYFMTFILRFVFLFVDSSRGSTMVRCLDLREEKLPKIKDLEQTEVFTSTYPDLIIIRNYAHR